VFGQLRRDCDRCRTQGFYFVGSFLQSIQLRIAIRSPASAEDGENDGSHRQQVRRLHHPAAGIGQAETRKTAADSGSAIQYSRGSQVRRGLTHDGSFLLGHPLFGSFAQGIEFFS
jgi:hypothetical protein